MVVWRAQIDEFGSILIACMPFLLVEFLRRSIVMNPLENGQNAHGIGSAEHTFQFPICFITFACTLGVHH
jgi:hypothetical protein